MKKPLFLVMLLCSILTSAQYTVLYDFGSVYGYYPEGNLVLSGNQFYGTTSHGGWAGFGCIFSIDTSGSNYRELFTFNNTNGDEPVGTPVICGNKMYGITFYGAAN